jgi:hypothetical protein
MLSGGTAYRQHSSSGVDLPWEFQTKRTANDAFLGDDLPKRSVRAD